jgi:predicted Zn-dependent peptidase
MMNDVKTTRLENGATVISSSLPSVESVSVGIWVGVGGRYEEAARSGACHFIEHLLFKGTRKRSSGDISRAIEGRGGYLNAFTQEESTCYYARVAYDHLAVALDVLADMYLDPRFDPKEIDRERGVIIEEIMMYRDQPDHVVHELLSNALWPDHPVGRPLIGTPESLGNMGRRELLRFKEAWYVPSKTVFSFAGRVNHESCVAQVSRLLDGRKPGRPGACDRVPARLGQRPMVLQAKKIEQTHLAMGFRLFGRKDPRRYTLKVLSAVLGENMSSRLFQIVREKHGLAYSIHSGCSLLSDTGALTIGAGLDRRRWFKGLGLVAKELQRIKRVPVGDRELKRAKDYVVGQLRLSMESTSQQMLWIGDNIISFGRFVPPQETVDAIQSVDSDDVRRLAREVLVREHASIALVAPEVGSQDDRHVRNALDSL